MDNKLTCETCAHWRCIDRLTSYAGECGAGQYPGRVPFDHTCAGHSAHPTPPDMQSQVRGVPAIVQMWQARP